jgi:hypothetical protein
MLKEKKLINLIRSWPDGAVFTSEWLIHVKGYSKGLLQQYHRSGWIELIGKGAYRRAQIDTSGMRLKNSTPLRWQGGVWALQALQIRPEKNAPPQILVAARTALELSGYAHFVNLSGLETVWLFAEPSYHVPAWFKNYQWGAKIKIYSPTLFSRHLPGTISHKDWGPFVSQLSCPERAIMELLELCPQEESLEHAKLVMEGLATLRPQIIQELLESCTSIKVKRLFLALADLCGHDWLKEIKIKGLDLGSGSRVLASNQGFHPKYKISVPRGESA